MTMPNKSVLQGFPFTEEDIYGKHQSIPKDHLVGVSYVMIRLQYIFDQHKKIKINKGGNND